MISNAIDEDARESAHRRPAPGSAVKSKRSSSGWPVLIERQRLVAREPVEIRRSRARASEDRADRVPDVRIEIGWPACRARVGWRSPMSSRTGVVVERDEFVAPVHRDRRRRVQADVQRRAQAVAARSAIGPSGGAATSRARGSSCGDISRHPASAVVVDSGGGRPCALVPSVAVPRPMTPRAVSRPAPAQP